MKPMLKLAAVAVLAGCAAPELPEAQRIDGIDWILTEVNGLPWQGDASLHLDGDRLTGVGPCNAYSGRRGGTAPAFAVTDLARRSWPAPIRPGPRPRPSIWPCCPGLRRSDANRDSLS